MVVSFKKIVGIFIVDCWKVGGIIVSTAGLFDRTFCLVGCGRLCTVQYDWTCILGVTIFVWFGDWLIIF